MAGAAAGQPALAVKVLPEVDAAARPASTAAETAASRELARSVLATLDHRGGPFAIVDKQAAMIMVYRADGTLAGASAALLGRTLGDHAAPGVGERTQQQRLRPDDQTTTAGRFVSEPGRNLSGEPIVWIDYASALAIHRLRPGPAKERRAARLASQNALDRRASSGCVVVPERFYETVVQPLLGRTRGVVYVMREEGSPA
jgi:hypothetical protein